MNRPTLRESVYSLFRYNAFAFCVRLATGIVMARVLGPDQMGVWLLLSLIPTYAEGFGRLKADAAAIYVLPQGRWNLGEVSLAVNVIAALSSLPLVIGLLVFETQVMGLLFGELILDPLWYRLTVLLIPLQFHSLAYSYLILHFENVPAYNIQAALRVLLPAVVSALLLLSTPLRLGALVVSLLIGTALSVVYGMVVVHRHARPQFASQPGLYGALLSFGRRLYAAGAIEQLNQYLASLLVGLHLAPRQLAFFRLGQDRVQLLDQVTTSVTTLLFPRIARETDAEAQVDILAKSCRVLCLLLALGGILGALLAPAVIWALYGREFLPMTWSVWLFMPGVVALGATSPVTQYLMGCGKPEMIWKLALVPLLLQFCLLVPAITHWGFRGAALVVSLSFVSLATARLLALRAMTGRRASALLVPGAAEFRIVRSFIAERLRRIPFLKRA